MIIEMKSTTILAVDDEPNIIGSYELIFENNYKILSTIRGKEALEIIEKENVDVVILDIGLPDINGIDILRYIKKLDKDIDVIMVTAEKDPDTVQKAMKLGACDYITKPFDVDELLASVKKAAEKKRLTTFLSK